MKDSERRDSIPEEDIRYSQGQSNVMKPIYETDK